MTIYDQTVANFPRLPGETDDAPRLQRAIDAASEGILFVPKGLYLVATPLKVTNFASIQFHPRAVLRAVAEMDYILSYNGKENQREDNGIDNKSMLNLFIRGGVLDADGFGGCLNLDGVVHFNLSDITLENPRTNGLATGVNNGGYELMASNVYVHSDKPGLAGNVGVLVKIGDSHFTDIVVVDCTVGFDIWGGSSRFTRCHVWGGKIPGKTPDAWPEYLVDSVCFRVNYSSGNEHLMRDCYADTGYIGFEIHDNARLIGCAYLNAPSFKLDNPTMIVHTGGYLTVDQCFFRVTTSKGKVYTGDNNGVYWGENYFEGNEMVQPERTKKLW